MIIPTQTVLPTAILTRLVTPSPIDIQSSTQDLTTITPMSDSVSASFSEPDPETWVKFMYIVREYFYYRKKAMVAGSAEILWKRYPELKQGIDISKRINSEGNTISNYQGLKPFDGNVEPEGYERMKVKLSGENAEVLVHGSELYLYRDEAGNFEDSGGELEIVLFLRKDGNQWTLYKTMEVGMP